MKKTAFKPLLSVLLAAALLLGCTAAVSAASRIPGDINGDGKLTSQDARLALRAAVGLDRLSGYDLRFADVDRNGDVTSQDARLILRASVDLEDYKSDASFCDYLSKNFSLLHPEHFKDDRLTNTVFSALVEDVNGDGKKEFIAFCYQPNNDSSTVVMRLYQYKNGRFTLSDTSEPVYAGFAGNGVAWMCATLEKNTIRIYRDACGYGGSNYTEEYLSYRVSNGKFVLAKHFYRYEFPRNNIEEYTEEVSGRTYSSETAFLNAVKADGFDLSAHVHTAADVRRAAADKNPALAAPHIFCTYIQKSFEEGGTTGAFYDNTHLFEKVTG